MFVHDRFHTILLQYSSILHIKKKKPRIKRTWSSKTKNATLDESRVTESNWFRALKDLQCEQEREREYLEKGANRLPRFLSLLSTLSLWVISSLGFVLFDCYSPSLGFWEYPFVCNSEPRVRPINVALWWTSSAQPGVPKPRKNEGFFSCRKAQG